MSAFGHSTLSPLFFTIFTEEIWMTDTVENHGRIYLYIALAGDGGYFRCNEYRELGCNYCEKRVQEPRQKIKPFFDGK